VRSPPTDLATERLREELAQGWRIRAASLEYVPEGGGSHHWRLIDDDGRPHFVTVDDLDDKDWLADTRDAAFEGLADAFGTAEVLRRVAGLPFVVAPVATTGGHVLSRLYSRYALSVFPYLAGHAYRYGPYDDPELRDRALDLVIALHRSTPTVRDRAPHYVLRYGGRRDLMAFLSDPDRLWNGGPFSEPAHDLMAKHRQDVAELVTGFDRLVEVTATACGTVVITHGEPHPANLMAVEGRLHLVDWDTTGLAPPERDLSLIVAAPGEGSERYQRATGREVDFAVVTLYRLRWYLDDLASGVRLFRNPHAENPDTRRWWEGMAPRLEQLPTWLASLDSV
jgi:spectinomycin phosphotransferase